MRSGFATLVGRPNAGKSTLLNTILGTKVSIVSDKPQTTRTRVRGLLNRADAQVVFVDTPGIHRPRTLLGERLNETATGAVGDVDVVCLVVDATAPIGPGDRWVAAQVPRERTICVVNKTDVADREQTLRQLTAAAELDLAEYFPVSARTGDGVEALVDAIVGRLPEGPAYYPDDMVTDVPEAFWVAELVREQLLAHARDELPHAIAVTTDEVEERTTGSGEPLLALRVILGDTASLDVTGREYFVSRVGAPARGGHDNIARLDAWFTVRVHQRHGIAIRYLLNRRDAFYPDFGESSQTRGTIGIFYTLLGHERFGAVDWR